MPSRKSHGLVAHTQASPPAANFNELLPVLALARIFLRNKPAELTCKEFAAELHAARGEAPRTAGQANISGQSNASRVQPFIDVEKLWRARAGRATDNAAALKRENEKLKAQNASLKIKLDKRESGANQAPLPCQEPPRKRAKRGSAAAATTSSQSAMLHYESAHSILLNGPVPIVATLTEQPGNDTKEHSLVIAVYRIYRLVKAQPKDSLQELSRAVEQAVLATSGLVDGSAMININSQRHRCIQAAMTMSFDALKHFQTAPQKQAGQMLLAFLQLFRNMLGRVQEIVKEARNTDEAAIILNPKFADGQICWREIGKQKAALEAIAASLRIFVALIAAQKDDLHIKGSLVEGVLYLLLQRAGQLMNRLVFAQDDDTCNLPVEAQLRAAASTEQSDEAKSELVERCNAEAQVLMPLLRLVMPAYVASRSSSSKSGSTEAVCRMSKLSLVTIQERKMQKTLQTAIFGSQENASSNLPGAAVRDMLQLMQQGAEQGADEDAAQAKALHDEGAWFVESVWALMGWDVLAEVWDCCNKLDS